MVKPLTEERPCVLLWFGLCGVSDVHAADVQMREASCDREDAEDKADDETDEIDGFHALFAAWLRKFPAGRLSGVGEGLWFEDLEEAID